MPASGIDWGRKKVLVTGATGMLGSSLIPQLRQRNAIVYAMSRDGIAVADTREPISCDLTDSKSITHHLEATAFDFILHLAGQSQDTDVDPKATFDTNVIGTLNLLEAVRLKKSEATVVIASTSAITPRWQQFSQSVDQPPDVRPYPASKMCVEVLARCYRDSYGLRVGVVRLPNLFGPCDLNLRRLVPGIICAVIKEQVPVIRSDPQTPINFLYVDEAAEAILRFAEQFAIGGSKQSTESIRSQESVSLGEMVIAILTQMDRLDLLPEMPVVGASMKNGTTPPPVEPFPDDANWQPQIPLREGLQRTIDWYRQHYNE